MGNKDREKNGTGKSNGKNEKGKDKKFLSPDGGGGLEKSPSLQRIHQQSSTETSGLGETITSGFSSQESIRSSHSFNDKGERYTAESSEKIGKNPDHPDSSMKERADTKPLIIRSSGGGSSGRDRGRNENTTRINSDKSKKNMYPDGTNFDELFTNPGKPRSSYHDINLGQGVDNEWDRRGSIRSRGSIHSQGSFTGSNIFLGKATESAWTKWSKERRASFRRKLEVPNDQCQEPHERASTPIKKAREEGMIFIHDDLKGNYISEDDINYIRRHRLQRYKTYHVIEKSKKSLRNFSNRTEVNLTVRDWHILTDFWEHHLFARCRYAALLFGFLSVVFMLISVTSSHWVNYQGAPANISTNATSWTPVDSNVTAYTGYEGLWMKCKSNAQLDKYDCDISIRGFHAGIWNCRQNVVNDTGPCQDLERSDDRGIFKNWQTAVIGLMIFSASFGLVAAILAIIGVCTSPLPKKIYYFHSAGEIFLVCAISVAVALVIYPVALEMDNTITSKQYGAGYGLGWGGAFSFLLAALCMSLDEFVREASRTKCCRIFFMSRQSERSELQPV